MMSRWPEAGAWLCRLRAGDGSRPRPTYSSTCRLATALWAPPSSLMTSAPLWWSPTAQHTSQLAGTSAFRLAARRERRSGQIVIQYSSPSSHTGVHISQQLCAYLAYLQPPKLLVHAPQ